MAPWKFPWISDCIEGSSSEAPRPPMTAQKTTIGHRLCDRVIDSAPAAYPSNPSTYARLRPIRSPILLPIRMNAAETSASSAIADCTPLAVVSRSCTTAEIETFISDVSTTSTNIAIASRIASAVLKPILAILTLPLIILTLGFFYLLINIAMVLLAEWIAPNFSIDGFWTYVGVVFVIWIVNVVAYWAIDAHEGGGRRARVAV